MEYLLQGKTVAGLDVWRVCSFCFVVLAALLVGRLSKLLLDRAAKHAGASGKDLVVVALRALGKGLLPIAFALGLSLGLAILTTDPRFTGVLRTIMRVVNAAAIGYAIYCLVDIVDYYLKKIAERTEGKVDDMLVPLVGKSIRITILVLAVLQVVDSLSDKPLSTVVAGLGVGGLAVALAAQDTLKNFFGSLVIVGDKPFEIGDRIVVDGHDGPVVSVGFRSTKIRTLNGHLVTVPNSEIVNRTVLNIGKRPYIKRTLNIAVTYDTPPEKVELAVQILRDLLKDHEGLDPEFPARVFFNDFKDWSLNILVLIWYHPPDYWKFMEFSERLNMEVLKRFNDEGIVFAFPSETVYLKGMATGGSNQQALPEIGGDPTA